MNGCRLQQNLGIVMFMAIAILLGIESTVATTNDQPVASCQPSQSICEFWLNVEHKVTMMKESDAVYPKGGQLYMWDDTNASMPVDMSDVISADGWEKQRLVIVINGSFPGPNFEVWEGQTIIVHVTNLMSSTSVTIHWHGLHQQGTPWMDGVGFVTQCPIEAQQTFTYKFKASPSGTFWYHSHIGSQRSMGLAGAFIIRRRIVDKPHLEHTLMLQEWNHDYDSDVIHSKMLYGNFESREKQSPTKSIEGARFSMFPFHSGLINGRGRYYHANSSHNEAPLTTFKVTPNETYRFRMIGIGSLYPFRVSIDDHTLTVVASDGYELQPRIVDAIIINPGERFDFLVHTNRTVGSYLIRAVTLEVDVSNHVAEAILEYDGSTDPIHETGSTPRVCSVEYRCRVLNCPFLHYPVDYFSDCITLDQLKSEKPHQVPGGMPGDQVTDIFLNFAFPGTTWTPGSVNGRAFQHPPVSALTQPQELSQHQCDPSKCGEDKICSCPYSISLEYKRNYQIIMSNMGSGRGWAHPIHMHGHSFYVVKMGFPYYDNVTGQVGADNPEIDCAGQETEFCNAAKWTNSTWGCNSVPGLQFDSPIRKDTIIVPSGGYVVIRIKADNPGLWFMHCHVELHSSDGMSVMLNESFPYQPPPPAGFPTCGSFTFNENYKYERL